MFARSLFRYGGVCGPDNKVYCIPHTAHTVLRITPETGAVEHLGDLGEGAYKWHGGVLGRDGCIYGFPAHADAVLKIDCASGEVSLIGDCRIEGVRCEGRRTKWVVVVSATYVTDFSLFQWNIWTMHSRSVLLPTCLF